MLLYSQVQLLAQEDCVAPTELNTTELLDSNVVYFTYPSSDNLNLVLWYADETGSYKTDLTFPPSTVLRLSPTSSQIVAVEFLNEYYLYGDEVYEQRGSTLHSIDVFETSTMKGMTLSLPEEWDDIPFIRRVIWIDNETILILSKTEYHIAGVINISTGEFRILDWLDIMPPSLDSWSFPYTEAIGGLMLVSPSGDHLYYTLADPFVPSIHWSLITPDFSVLAWTIINWDSEEVVDYRGGVGAFTRWFDEESIITLDTDSYNLLRISLDGSVQRLTEDVATLYYRFLASPNGAKVALTTEIDERNGFHQEQPAILNTDTREITHYCVDAIHIGKESWSSDGRLLIYVARSTGDNLEDTEIFVLDTEDNRQISLSSPPVDSDAVGSRFVRVVGISN